MNVNDAINLLVKELESWVEIAVKAIPNVILALLVFFGFWLLAKYIRIGTRKLMRRVNSNRAVDGLIENFVYFLVLCLGLFLALGILNLDKTLTSLLAGAGVIGLALGFAFQEIASNFVSGVFIAFRQPYQLGDIIKIDDFFGEVTSIDLRTTSITTFDGLEAILPNKKLFTESFVNYTTTPVIRVELSVGVSYGEDLDRVEKITLDALKGIDGLIKDRDIQFFYDEFGGSSINFNTRIWVEFPGNGALLKAKHDAIKVIKKAFDENDISIPFPIRTLDFGIKGGENLKHPLQNVFRSEAEMSEQ